MCAISSAPIPVPRSCIADHGAPVVLRGAHDHPRLAAGEASGAVRSECGRSAVGPRGGVPAAWTAWRALVRMLTSAVRSRSASVIAGGSAGSRSNWTSGSRMPGPGGGHRGAADVVEVGRCQIEADRLGEVEHVGDQVVQPLRFIVDVRHGFAARSAAQTWSRRSDDSDARMIISGLRIS